MPAVLDGPEAARAARQSALEQARALAAAAPPLEEAMAALRRAKAQTHLAVAILDLAGVADLSETTAAITAFADAATAAGLAAAARSLAEQNRLEPADPTKPEGPIPGFIVLAMGKGGAGELNYSSDVDLSLFFDPERLPVRAGQEPRPTAQRITQLLVRALEQITPDGYVFRTDLRLRPDPNSTSPAVTVAAALNYYQSLGQNWERAAFIKARPCAGDIPAGKAFLKSLEGFVWRRHLDYAAIEDIHAIKRRIRAAKGAGGLSDPAFDVKLGWGGIRDIELFVQTQQLILGGRRPTLRAPRTLEALTALVAQGALGAEEAEMLAAAYVFFRHVEHRLQMVADEQTHRMPADPSQAARIATLCGFGGLDRFDEAMAAHRSRVIEIDQRLFSDAAGGAADDPLAGLRFTGVENDPATDAHLRSMGYGQPDRVGAVIRDWQAGRMRALRTERARRLMAGLTPAILRAGSQSDEPDRAFARFADLIAGLSAGVQVLSLYEAHPALIAETAAALAVSQPLAETLSRRPALLDLLAEPRFFAPLRGDAPDAVRQTLLASAEGAKSLDDAMNAARRAHREETFRIAMQILKGVATAAEAGRAYADLAEASVEAMAAAAVRAVVADKGPIPGAYCVLGLGKLGGRELAAGSDLDVMVVYEPHEGVGPDSVGAFAKLTQRLIAALSAPTEEGLLYEVDMQLRPSGAKGPVAVRLSSFARYYREEAWTWELLALTRARPVAGDATLGARIAEDARTILAAPRDRATVLQDAAAMRARMERERPAAGPWDLKLKPGGLVDVEFIAQALQITAGDPRVLSPNTTLALAALAKCGALPAEEAVALIEAQSAYADLQQVLRLCAPSAFDPAAAGAQLRALLARALGVVTFDDVEARLRAHARTVRRIFLQRVGDGSGQGPPLKSTEGR
jgi:glutamate-ammonia-ligase adenylyltransferase